jgi:Cytochrome c3
MIAGVAWLLFSASACGVCHQKEARSQPATPMGHALERVEDCAILRDHPRLTFQHDRYSYTITRQGNQSIYTVTDGADTITVPIGWAFGLGEAGQTYVFERDGVFYESRVSFYQAVNGLDITMGAPALGPQNLTQAAGREMTPGESVQCFGCHTTGAVRNFTLNLDHMQAGIQCENCHTDAPRHAAALKAGDAKSANLPRLAGMSAEESADFCGRCHRTWEQIASTGPRGILNIRFQPYRLTNSKCYDAADPRISCTACHDPHADVVRTTASYDSKCQACHTTGAKATGKVCPVAKRDCVSCHMPKLDLPGAHRKFTDHLIRVVKADGSYPD